MINIIIIITIIVIVNNIILELNNQYSLIIQINECLNDGFEI